jgi:F-type H+-transporting ATPase subunit epsilon
MAFRCVIVTPESQVLDQSVTQVILPAHDGQLGVLTDRAPILVKLGRGDLLVDVEGGRRQAYVVKGGVAQMKDNVLTVATTEATTA